MTASAPALRPLLPKDIPFLLRITRASIEQLAQDEYSPGQIEAWVASFEDQASFTARVTAGLTLIATLDGFPAGYAMLKGQDEIDLLYVAPGVVRRGVASALIEALEKLAVARGATKLTVKASDVARPFFSARGYEPQSRNTVPLGEEWLGYTVMMKSFGAQAPSLQ
ncbi:MAG: GNAT family N-acetyltransferase [Hyphomicrobiales bacterium]|jgi:putative acetyltransferase|nr:GNAT family N-acetyltransferase [Hyphomicrobiales bacterium]